MRHWLLTILLLVIAGMMSASRAAGEDVVIAEKAIDKWMYHGRVNKLLLSPDGKRLYIGWNGAYVFDTEQLVFKEIPVKVFQTTPTLQNPDGSPVRSWTTLTLTPDGRKLYVYDYGAPAINVVDTQTFTTTKVISIAPLEEVRDFTVSQDGKKLFIAGSHHLSRIRSEANRANKILVVDIDSNAITKVLDIGKQHVVWFLLADDRPVVYGLVQGKLGGGPVVEDPDLVIDVEKGEVVSKIYLPKDKTAVRNSTIKGNLFYNVSYADKTSNSLNIFNLQNGQKIEGISLPRFAFQPSPVKEERWLYVRQERSILLVNLQSKEIVKDFEIYNPSFLQRLKGQARPDYTENMVLSKDGKRLYVAGLLFQSKWTPFFDLPPPPVKLVITIVDAEQMRRDTK